MARFGVLLRGIVMGLSIAAPVGPIGVLCIRRTLAQGRAVGLVSGLGAATADALYGCIAGFGLAIISGALIRQQAWLRLAGGLFLCYLGIKTFLAHPTEEAAAASDTGLAGAYATTFLLTLTNPMTILSFLGVFAGLGMASDDTDYATAAVLVAGVFAGSALWWLLLSGAASSFRGRITAQGLRWINRGSGAVITVFGLLTVLS